MDDAVELDHVRLQKMKLVALKAIEGFSPFAEPPELEFSAYCSWSASDLMMRLVQSVWGREVERQECVWPADWWQAFKERWYPAWAKHRWPVEYRRVEIVARELYPKLQISPQMHEVVVAVDKMDWGRYHEGGTSLPEGE